MRVPKGVKEALLKANGVLFAKSPKKSKYHNVKTTVDGIVFSSKREANRYSELLLMQQAGLIGNLQLQVPYELVVNGIHICSYICDFRYDDMKTGFSVTEDTKGMRTDVYRMKARLMIACHGIVVLET